MTQKNMDELKRENLCLRQKVERLNGENEKLRQEIEEFASFIFCNFSSR